MASSVEKSTNSQNIQLPKEKTKEDEKIKKTNKIATEVFKEKGVVVLEDGKQLVFDTVKYDGQIWY